MHFTNPVIVIRLLMTRSKLQLNENEAEAVIFSKKSSRVRPVPPRVGDAALSSVARRET